MNDKHLLWWVLKAVDAGRNYHGILGSGCWPLAHEQIWENIGAPDWVLPAIREKFEEMGILTIPGCSISEGPWDEPPTPKT